MTRERIIFIGLSCAILVFFIVFYIMTPNPHTPQAPSSFVINTSQQPQASSASSSAAISPSTTQPEPSTTITNWKTYTNKTIGFTMQYPATWKTSENATTVRIVKPSPDTNPVNQTAITISIVNQPFDQSDTNFKDGKTNTTLLVNKKVTIDGYSGYYYQVSGAGGTNDSTNVVLPYPDRSKTLLIGIAPRSQTAVFDQMLNSFHLTNAK